MEILCRERKVIRLLMIDGCNVPKQVCGALVSLFQREFSSKFIGAARQEIELLRFHDLSYKSTVQQSCL